MEQMAIDSHNRITAAQAGPIRRRVGDRLIDPDRAVDVLQKQASLAQFESGLRSLIWNTKRHLNRSAIALDNDGKNLVFTVAG